MSQRHLLISLAAALIVLPFGAAQASGDGCEPTWSLDFAAKPQCANIPVLVPGNDTRTNLLILLADRHKAPDSQVPVPKPVLDWPEFRDSFAGVTPDALSADYADGEGSRCLSNDAGIKAFTTAVAGAAGLSPDERKLLTQARADLKPSCAGSAPASPAAADPDLSLSGVTSPQGRAYATYLRVTDAFYAGRFDEARTGAKTLASSSDPWLAETASYMVGRIAVNRMQVDAYDQYGTFKGASAVDQALAQEAEYSLDAYVILYPRGRYTSSALGLHRRVFWLAGWTDKLASSYAALLANPPATRSLTDAALAEEIDNKLLPSLQPAMTRDPTLLAVLDLFAIRKADKGTPQLPRPNLSEQREAFASNPGLYGYLEGVLAYYGDRNPKAVTAGIPDDARRRDGDHLWFSRQFLRGLALEASGDRNARGFWKELVPAAGRPLDRATAELALALNEERRGDVADAFAPGTPITNEAIRTILLTNGADQGLLRARAGSGTASPRERQVALYTLLRKELTHGLYQDFLTDLSKVPADAPKNEDVQIAPLGDTPIPLGLFTQGETKGDIGCPRLQDTAGALARDPVATGPRLCLAEFLRLNNFDPGTYTAPRNKAALGSGPSGFPGEETTRGSIYASVIADRSAPPNDRAYALYRAVKCYEPSGYNVCGGADVPKAQRGRWHDMLKREFPGFRWAKEIRYWW